MKNFFLPGKPFFINKKFLGGKQGFFLKKTLGVGGSPDRTGGVLKTKRGEGKSFFSSTGAAPKRFNIGFGEKGGFSSQEWC
jgi:hypothetical protein